MQLNDENMERMRQGAGPIQTELLPVPQRRTGRLRHPDIRDTDYLLDETALRGIRREQTKARAIPWRIGDILNQGDSDECVIYCYAAFRQAAPFFCKSIGWTKGMFDERYQRAKELDEIPGVNYDGTTARGAMKAAEAVGEVNGYLWVPPTNGEDITKEYLATRGTLMQGTDWPATFFAPNKHGYVEPDNAPPAAMGHETLVRWYHKPTHRKYPDSYECVNSWGRSFGLEGRFFIKAEVFRWLHWQCGGDLVSPIETARIRAGGIKL